MDELQLATRLHSAVAADPPVQLDLHAVVAAGRRRQRTRAAAAGGVLALVVAVGVAVPAVLAGDGDGQPDRVTVAGPAAPASPAPEPSLDPLDGADLSVVSPAQAAEIADRVVTEQDYRAAYGRYRACMGAAGYELEVMPPVLASGVHSFAVPDEAVQSGVDEACYMGEFRFTDMLWQTSPAVQDSPAAVQERAEQTEQFRDCLRERGIEPRESAQEVEQQVREADLLLDCLQS